jgi:hypothetical protein
MPNFVYEIQQTVERLNRLIKLAAFENMAVELSVYSKHLDGVECGLLECRNLQGYKNNEPAQKNSLLLYHQQ